MPKVWQTVGQPSAVGGQQWDEAHLVKWKKIHITSLWDRNQWLSAHGPSTTPE